MCNLWSTELQCSTEKCSGKNKAKDTLNSGSHNIYTKGWYLLKSKPWYFEAKKSLFILAGEIG